MTRMPFVVDTNYLRRDELSALAADDAAHLFVLPDLVMFESAKSTNRELTIRESLRILSTIPDRVFLARSISELLKAEIELQRPMHEYAINHDATPAIRRILEAVRDDATNEILAEVIDDPTGYIQELRRDHLTHEKNRENALEFQSEILKQFKPEFLQRLRRDQVSDKELLLFLSYGAPKVAFETLWNQHGFSEQSALNMINSQSITVRYIYVRYWVALQLAKRSRFAQRPADQISNDNIDAHNVVAATAIGGLLCCDELANSAFAAVIMLLAAGNVYRVVQVDGRPTVEARK